MQLLKIESRRRSVTLETSNKAETNTGSYPGAMGIRRQIARCAHIAMCRNVDLFVFYLLMIRAKTCFICDESNLLGMAHIRMSKMVRVPFNQESVNVNYLSAIIKTRELKFSQLKILVLIGTFSTSNSSI